MEDYKKQLYEQIASGRYGKIKIFIDQSNKQEIIQDAQSKEYEIRKLLPFGDGLIFQYDTLFSDQTDKILIHYTDSMNMDTFQHKTDVFIDIVAKNFTIIDLIYKPDNILVKLIAYNKDIGYMLEIRYCHPFTLFMHNEKNVHNEKIQDCDDIYKLIWYKHPRKTLLDAVCKKFGDQYKDKFIF